MYNKSGYIKVLLLFRKLFERVFQKHQYTKNLLMKRFKEMSLVFTMKGILNAFLDTNNYFRRLFHTVSKQNAFIKDFYVKKCQF